jgi:hypothetical protein
MRLKPVCIWKAFSRVGFSWQRFVKITAELTLYETNQKKVNSQFSFQSTFESNQEYPSPRCGWTLGGGLNKENQVATQLTFLLTFPSFKPSACFSLSQ